MPHLPELADLEPLRAYDTPTICNALELVAPARRAVRLHPQTAARRLSGDEAGRSPLPAPPSSARANRTRAAASRQRRCGSAITSISPTSLCRASR